MTNIASLSRPYFLATDKDQDEMIQHYLRFRPVSAPTFLQSKNRQKNPFLGILTVSIVAGVRLELTTFGL
jgi:hypothetical protein